MFAMQELMVVISPRAPSAQPRQGTSDQEPASSEPDDTPIRRDSPCEGDSECGITESGFGECGITESGFGECGISESDCIAESGACPITSDSTCPVGPSLCEPGQSDCPPESVCPPGSGCLPGSICEPLSCPLPLSTCQAESGCGRGETVCRSESLCWNESLVCQEDSRCGPTVSLCAAESGKCDDSNERIRSEPDSSFDLNELKASLLQQLLSSSPMP